MEADEEGRLDFRCACGQGLEVPPEMAGEEMDCPFCGASMLPSEG